MKSKIGAFSMLAASLVLVGQGCLGLGSQPTGNDGAVWLTIDAGEAQWGHLDRYPLHNGVQSIAAANVNMITADPQDNNAIYIGTTNGMYFSYNAGRAWQRSAQSELSSGNVTGIVVDPSDKCTIYVANGKRLMKSTDCNRTYDVERYSGDYNVTSLAIDWFNPKVIWLGLSSGEVLRSDNGGVSWTTVERLRADVIDIMVSNKDSRIVFASTDSRGVYRTKDGGFNWERMTETVEDLDDAKKIVDMAQDASGNNIYLAAREELYYSPDLGDTWSTLNLVTPDKAASRLYSLAVDPQDGRKAYYGTKTTFYATTDIGNTWRTEDLPSTRAATALMVDAKNGNNIYLGVTYFEEN